MCLSAVLFGHVVASGCGAAGPSTQGSTPVPIELPSSFAMPSTLSISVTDITSSTSGSESSKAIPGSNSIAQSLYQTNQDNTQLDDILSPLSAVTASTSTAVTNAIGSTTAGGVWFVDFAAFTFPTLASDTVTGVDCSTTCSGNSGALPICFQITVGGKKVLDGKITSPVTSSSKGAGCFYAYSAVTDSKTEAALFDGTNSYIMAGLWDHTDTTALKLDVISATTTTDSSGILNSGTRSVLTQTSSSSSSVSVKSSSSTVVTANVSGKIVDNGESKTVTAINRWNSSVCRTNITLAGNATTSLNGCVATGTTTTATGCLEISDVTLVAQRTPPDAPSTSSDAAPSVASTSPANAATGVALNPTITITFSEAMDTSSITSSTFKLTTGAGTAIGGTITTTSTTATFTPTTILNASTTYTITVTNGITDVGGKKLNATTTTTFTTGTEVDSSVPSISSTSPADDATRIAINAAVTATFSEAVNSSTVTTSSFSLAPSSGGSNVAATVGYSGTTATLTPSSNLSNSTLYTATLTTAIQDTAGNALSTNKIFDFRTISPSAQYDVLFSTNGYDTQAHSTTDYDDFEDVVLQSDGKMVAVGTVYSGGNQDILIVRYDSSGTIDTTFGTNGVTSVNIASGSNDYANGVALQSDGKILVAAYTINSGNTERNFIVLRLTTGGALDTTYSSDGIAESDFSGGADTDTAYELVVNSSGQAILCGQIAGRAGLARYGTDGSLDTSFGSSGTFSDASYDSFYDCALDADGKIVAIGEDTTFDTPGQDVAIARFSAAGALDTSFSVDGRDSQTIGSTSDDQGLGVAIQSDGKIVIVGQTNNSSTSNDCLLLRYGTTGNLDSDFGTSGVLQFGNDAGGELQDICYDIGIHSGGRIVVIGSSTGDALIARITSSGTLNTAFDSDGLAVFTEAGGARGLALDSNEDYVGVGSASSGGTDTFIFRVIQ